MSRPWRRRSYDSPNVAPHRLHLWCDAFDISRVGAEHRDDACQASPGSCRRRSRRRYSPRPVRPKLGQLISGGARLGQLGSGQAGSREPDVGAVAAAPWVRPAGGAGRFATAVRRAGMYRLISPPARRRRCCCGAALSGMQLDRILDASRAARVRWLCVGRAAARPLGVARLRRPRR
jgi:hypothetical protein